MTTDFRALCAELEEAYTWCIEEYMTDPAEQDTLIQRARAALAQPKPEGPTLAELDDLCAEHGFHYEDGDSLKCLLLIIADALARWGTPNLAETRKSLVEPADAEAADLVKWLWDAAEQAAAADWLDDAQHLNRAAALLSHLSPPQPIPVKERLPGPGDCDAEGRCWYGAPDRSGAVACWDLEYEPATDDTHWLPAHALPVPAEAQG